MAIPKIPPKTEKAAVPEKRTAAKENREPQERPKFRLCGVWREEWSNDTTKGRKPQKHANVSAKRKRTPQKHEA